MSAIEYIKEMLKSPKYSMPIMRYEKQILEKALLALEKQEKLKDAQDYLATIIFNIEDLNYSDDDDIVGDLKKLNSKLKEVGDLYG